jgi:hypothetical protein
VDRVSEAAKYLLAPVIKAKAFARRQLAHDMRREELAAVGGGGDAGGGDDGGRSPFGNRLAGVDTDADRFRALFGSGPVAFIKRHLEGNCTLDCLSR